MVGDTSPTAPMIMDRTAIDSMTARIRAVDYTLWILPVALLPGPPDRYPLSAV